MASWLNGCLYWMWTVGLRNIKPGKNQLMFCMWNWQVQKMKIFQRGKTVSLRGIITNPEKIRLLSVLYNPPASCHKDQRSECAVRPKLIFPLSRIGASKIMAAVEFLKIWRTEKKIILVQILNFENLSTPSHLCLCTVGSYASLSVCLSDVTGPKPKTRK